MPWKRVPSENEIIFENNLLHLIWCGILTLSGTALKEREFSLPQSIQVLINNAGRAFWGS